MAVELWRNIREDTGLRESFFALSRQVFQLDFAPWYGAGCWGEEYRPLALVEDGTVLANVSVNRMTLLADGERRKFLQLGTVMTRPDCRGRGYARRLLEAVLADWEQEAEGVYLFANEEVLDFYPKFGFVPVFQWQPRLPVEPAPGREPVVRLEMTRQADRALLLDYYRRSNPHSALAMVENPGLLQFYTLGPLARGIYHLPQSDAVVLLETGEETPVCWEVFGGERQSLSQLLAAVTPAGCREVALGFSPLQPPLGMEREPVGVEDTLFVLSGGESPCCSADILPLLSHA